MNHGQVAGVFMSGPFTGFRPALQDGLWNLPNERIDERWGALQGRDDHFENVGKFLLDLSLDTTFL